MCDHFWPIIRVCTMSGRSIFETDICDNRPCKPYGSNWIRHLFRKCNAGSNIYLPRLSVRHVSDGITGIENILKYYILMSVVLYISIDNTGTNVHIGLCINYVN